MEEMMKEMSIIKKAQANKNQTPPQTIKTEIEIRNIEETTIKISKKKVTNRLDLPFNKTM